MCQNIAADYGISHEGQKENKAISYEVVGSGLSGNFCISGEREIKTSPITEYRNNVPIQENTYYFKLVINIIGGK